MDTPHEQVRTTLETPLGLLAAEADLAALEGARVIKSWRHLDQTDNPGIWWLLELELDLLEHPPTDFVPPKSDWVLTISQNGENWGEVRIFPSASKEGIYTTFQHQEFNGRLHPFLPCRNGFLCTNTEMHGLAVARHALSDEPTFLSDRIIWHVRQAQRFLMAASQNALSVTGHPYELPDFRTLPENNGLLCYYEEESFLVEWENAPRAGIAEFIQLTEPSGSPAVCIKEFKTLKGKSILRPAFGSIIGALPSVPVPALWIQLNQQPTKAPWQAPANGGELAVALKSQGISLSKEMERLWPFIRGKGNTLLFLGWPIPEVVGGEPKAMHWQGLNIPAIDYARPGTELKRSFADYGKVFAKEKPLHWLPKSENWHPKVLLNRGKLVDPLCNAKILLIGCGALGSEVAETLVRMGVVNMVVADFDSLEAGNLVRHTLTLQDLFQNKAAALSRRLNLVNPSAKIGFLPIQAHQGSKNLEEAVSTVNLVLDFTASDRVMNSLPFTSTPADALLVSGSVGINAEHLYLYADIASSFKPENFNSWFQPYREEENRRAKEMKLPQAAGCWHPVTPVPLNRLKILSGSLVEHLQQLVANKCSLPLANAYLWANPIEPKA